MYDDIEAYDVARDDRATGIRPGDRVRYRAAFLRSCGMYTGDVPFARGTVTELITLSGDCVLAQIDWDTPDVPVRVNVANLEICR